LNEKLNKYSVTKYIMLVSLGPKNCLLINDKKILLEGILASQIKKFVDYKIMNLE
jgi:hypothetical protein